MALTPYYFDLQFERSGNRPVFLRLDDSLHKRGHSYDITSSILSSEAHRYQGLNLVLTGITTDPLPTELMDFPILRKLRIMSCADTRAFQTAAQLTHLSIGGGLDLEAPFAQFNPWTKLQFLHFNEVYILPSTLLAILRQAPNIYALDLDRCGSSFVEGEELHMAVVTLPSLRYLHLHFGVYRFTSQILATRINDTHLDHLKVSEVDAGDLQAVAMFLGSRSGSAHVTAFKLVSSWRYSVTEASLLESVLLSVLRGLPALQRLYIHLQGGYGHYTLNPL